MANYSFMGVQLSNSIATYYAANGDAASYTSYSTVTRETYSDSDPIINKRLDFMSTNNTYSVAFGPSQTLIANRLYVSSLSTPVSAMSLMLSSQTSTFNDTSNRYASSTLAFAPSGTSYTQNSTGGGNSSESVSTYSDSLVTSSIGTTTAANYTRSTLVPSGTMTYMEWYGQSSGSAVTLSSNQNLFLVTSYESITNTTESSGNNWGASYVSGTTLTHYQYATQYTDRAHTSYSSNTYTSLQVLYTSGYTTSSEYLDSNSSVTSTESGSGKVTNLPGPHYTYLKKTFSSSTEQTFTSFLGKYASANVSWYITSSSIYTQAGNTNWDTSVVATGTNSASTTLPVGNYDNASTGPATSSATSTLSSHALNYNTVQVYGFTSLPITESVSVLGVNHSYSSTSYTSDVTATFNSKTTNVIGYGTVTLASSSITGTISSLSKTVTSEEVTLATGGYDTQSSSISVDTSSYSYQQDNSKYSMTTSSIYSMYTATASVTTGDIRTFSVSGYGSMITTSTSESSAQPNGASVISTASLSLAQTVSGSCYTYLTSYTGSLEYTSNFDTYSTDTWLNMAVVSTSTEENEGTYNDNGYGILKQVSSTVSESTFGISQYDSTVQRQTSTVTAATNFGFIGTTFDYFRDSSLVVRTVSVSASSHNDVTQYFRSTTSSFSYTDINGALGYDNMYADSYNNEVYFNYLQNEQYNTSSSSNYDTVNYGTSYRQSTAVGSTSEAHAVSDSIIQNYTWNYEVKSMWSYDTMLSTISTYSTQLKKQFTYSNASASSSVGVISYTASTADTMTSLTGRTAQTLQAATTQTWSTIQSKSYSYYSTVTAAPYSMITATSLNVNINYTTANTSLVTSTADLSYATTSITSGTYQTVNSGFNYSSSSIVATSYEQISSTMQFYSTVQYGTTYSATVTASSVTSSYVDISATANTALYNGTTSTIYSSVNGTTYVSSTAEYSTKLNTFTSTVTYTPIYSSSNGIFVTTL